MHHLIEQTALYSRNITFFMIALIVIEIFDKLLLGSHPVLNGLTTNKYLREKETYHKLGESHGK